MKVLFLAHPDFFSTEDRIQALLWCQEFSQALKQKGVEASFFDSVADQIEDFDGVHFFSPEGPIIWDWVRLRGKPAVVTPALFSEPPTTKPSGSPGSRFFSFLGRLCRGCLQRRWPPMDRQYFFQSASHYFVPSGCAESWLSAWDIPRAKISCFSREDIAGAAREAARLYSQLCKKQN